jgi:hypothetical protein
VAALSMRRIVAVALAVLLFAGCGGGTSETQLVDARREVAKADLELATYCLRGGDEGTRAVRRYEHLYRSMDPDEKIDDRTLRRVVQDAARTLDGCDRTYARQLRRLAGDE